MGMRNSSMCEVFKSNKNHSGGGVDRRYNLS